MHETFMARWRSKAPIDWERVERLMRVSITGRAALAGDEQALIERAYRSDPDRYRALHANVQEQEVARVRGGF